MAAPFIQTSFARGEIAPALWGHVDLAAFHVAASTLRNMYVGFRGGAYSRAGTRFVGRSRQNANLVQAKPRLVPFRFNLDQQYVLEFGDLYFRVISRGGYAVEPAFAVTAATQATPGQVTAPGHNFADGDWVSFAALGGMIELNGNSYIVANSNPGAGTFTLQDLDGNPLATGGYAAYTSGGTAARIYTVTAPYAAADLPLLKWTQSADTLSLAHPNYPPQELKRLGPLAWTIAAASFGATIAAPAAASASATVQPSGATSPPTLPCAYAYAVTAIDPKTGQESLPSPIANVVNSIDMAVTAGSIVVSWSPVAGAQFYNIYRSPASYNTKPGDPNVALPVPEGATLGLVGSSFGNQFVDSNIVGDVAQSPPLHKNPFAPGMIQAVQIGASSADWTVATVSVTTATGTGFIGRAVISGGAVVAVIVVAAGQDYRSTDTLVITGDGTSASGTLTVGPLTGTWPGVATYFQQRRVYSASRNNPDTYWMSQPGAPLNFDAAIPPSDADAITGTPWATQIDGIQWMVTMPLGLVTFTGAGVWQVGAPGSFASNPAAITPVNQIASPQGSVGSSPTIPPVQVDWEILFAEPDGSAVRELSYQLVFNIYTGTDVSWGSSHLLVGHPIMGWAWCRKPYRMLWSYRDDGMLLSFTRVKEQEVQGWARHTTQGHVRDLCAVTELPVDALYMVVQRPVAAGGTRYFIERMDDRLWETAEEAWCVDSATATVLPAPNAQLGASAASGAGVVFTSDPAIFTAGHVGQTIRAGGGIARVDSHVGPAAVIGTWLTPCRDLVPDDPAGTVRVQAAGDWTIAPNATRVGGLLHLAGRTVVGVADGALTGPLTVSATGFVDLPFAASLVILGLGFTAQMQSVYLGDQAMQGQRKAIPAVTARVEMSAPMQAGANQPDASAQSPPPFLVAWPGLAAANPADGGWPATYTNPGGRSVQPLFTGDIRIPIPADWRKPGQAAVQQTDPLPLAVLALIPEILPGDLPEIGYSPRRGRQEAGAGR